MSIQLYGIPNCDSVKKARKWLEAADKAYVFVDFKKVPPSTDLIRKWVEQAGIEVVLNKRGTTWRKLSDEQKAITDTALLIQLMADQPSLIKRPIIETNSELLVGFKAEQMEAHC